eukprot:Phypoly_transcript_01588.p1 GENE.Phypoly_transcript_01588~~Phypoly_transcript_01588.p1  ORF type:complete len:1004 (+),score=272.66 Phypoly_transcript_01588:199-3210(+)
MPLDRSNENGNSGRLKLVLRLDKPKNADAGGEKTSPALADRPRRTPNAKTTTHHAEDTYYSADKKIPKKHEEANVDHDDYEHRPTRKRKTPMDSNFVYSKKQEEEDEEEEKVEYKKPKKKSYKDAGGDAEGWEDDSVPTPPLTDHDTHSGFKLKLKLPKPAIPDAAEHANSKKPEVGSGDGKKKRRGGEEVEEAEETTPRSGVKLKIKSTTPVEQKAEGGSLKKPKPEPGVTTKRHSPPRREESSVEKREPRLQSREKPKPEPKPPPLDEDSAKMRKHLSGILGQLAKLDKQFYFTEPVTEDIAPMYFSIIPHPMDFKTMRKKLKEGKYKSVEALQADFQLICNNCMTYNPATTTYAKEAKRMLTVGNRLLEKYLDGSTTTSTTEHKPETRKDSDKTPTRQAMPSTTPNKSFSKPSTPSTTPNRAAPTPPNTNFGVAFPISSGQLSSMQHPISTTPQHTPYPVTPPMRKPPAYPTLTPPYSQRLPMSNANLASPMRPPQSLPLQKSMSTNSIFPRPNMGPPAPPTGANAPPRPQNPVGKPGSRPPVVSMGESQATQTQSMYPEQPKRKYVKLPVEEPPKPAPPQPIMKAPAKLVAKIGTIPLVTPANVPGSFVYSMYIPRFEPGAVPGSKSPTNEATPTPSTAPASPPTSTTTTTTTPTPSAPNPSSPLPLAPPTTKTANGNLAINYGSVNYVNNFVSVPSLHNTLPAPSAQDADDAWLRAPAKRVEENVELMEEIAHDCLDAMDSDSREQMLGFFSSLAQPQATSSLAFPKFATQALLPHPQPQQQPIKVIRATAPPPPTPTYTPASPPSLTGNPLLDAELIEQMSKLESLEITAQDLQNLQGLQIDLAELSSFLPALPALSSAPNSSLSTNPNPETTTTTTTTTTSSFSSPPASPTSPSITTTTTTPSVPPTPTDKAQATRIVQDILDKNLEHLWSLQLMQHERVSGTPTEGELKLASHICDGLFVLGTSIPPFMLTTKEAAKAAIEQSGLVTGKHRHMRV